MDNNNNNEKEALLKNLAQNGYNIGFGAKKHFKSYDILSSVPRLLSFCTISVGVIQLTNFYENNFTKVSDLISASLVIIGIIALVVDLSSENKDVYNKNGTILINFFNELASLYNIVKNTDDIKFISSMDKRRLEIVKEASLNSISKQIWFSGWLAHHSFFYEMQVDWITEELKLKFWKDKVPANFKLLLWLAIIAILFCVLIKIFSYICLKYFIY